VLDEPIGYKGRDGEQVRVSSPTLRLQPKAAETIALASTNSRPMR